MTCRTGFPPVSQRKPVGGGFLTHFAGPGLERPGQLSVGVRNVLVLLYLLRVQQACFPLSQVVLEETSAVV